MSSGYGPTRARSLVELDFGQCRPAFPGTGTDLAVVLVALAPALVLRRYRSRLTGTPLWATSPMGAVPLDHVNRLIAGWDVALIAAVIVSAL